MPIKSEQLFGKGNYSTSDILRLHILAELEKITAGSSSVGLATEATLVSVLNAIVASDQDIEVLLVRDTVTLIVYKQITDWTSGVPVVSYTDVNGTPFVPVNPMEYLDPSTVLNLMLTQDIAINANTSSGVRTPNLIRPTAAGTVAPITYSLSVSNVGAANGTFLGAALKPGETLNFDSGGIKNTFAANTFTYDATGTEFIIIYNS